MTSFGPTPLRDDQSHRSISTNEEKFIRSCLQYTSSSSSSLNNQKEHHHQQQQQQSYYRQDGRTLYESRPLRLDFHRTHGNSSTTVQFGKSTRVMTSVSCDIVPPPYSDRPNDGMVQIKVDLSPMANLGWESPEGGRSSSSDNNNNNANPNSNMAWLSNVGDESQRLSTTRIQRLLERTILNGGAIDTEALCVQSGEWVWKLVVTVTVLDYGGNILDAAGLATIAALRHFRLPCTHVNSDSGKQGAGGAGGGKEGIQVVHSDDREATPLPLHHTPVLISYALFQTLHESSNPQSSETGSSISTQQQQQHHHHQSITSLLDPSDREEMIAECPSLTFAFNKHAELCCLDFPGGVEISPKQFLSCAKKAKQTTEELCRVLENALSEANQRANVDRMERIRGGAVKAIVSSSEGNMNGIPFHETSVGLNDFEALEKENNKIMQEALTLGAKVAKQSEEEEQYRLRALDYAIGHVAAKVKDDVRDNVGGSNNRMAVSKQTSDKQGPFVPTKPSALMEAMLQSASLSSNNASTTGTTNDKSASFPTPSIPLKVPPVGFPPNVHSSLRTRAADDEFDQFVKKNTSHSSTNNKSIDMNDSDDEEEEEVTILQGEFSSEDVIMKDQKVQNDVTNKKEGERDDDEGEEPDISMDLVAAIKKKKSGTKKRRKQRK